MEPLRRMPYYHTCTGCNSSQQKMYEGDKLEPCMFCDELVYGDRKRKRSADLIGQKAAVKSAAKPMLSLLPWDILTDVAELMTNHGADKHPLEGWKQRDSAEHLDSALRHLVAHMAGIETDDESGRRHIIHAAARVLMLAYTTK